MVPIAPDRPSAAQCAIDRLRQPHRESLTSACELHPAVGFDQQMHMIPLHAEMQDAKGDTRAGRQRAAHGGEHARPTKRLDARGSAQGDVNRNARIMWEAAPVRDHWARRSRRSSRS
jgi:hypothetical protein